MKTIAIISRKGGAGKTTLAVYFAVATTTDPIIYPVAVLSTTTVPDEAQAFANYLTSIDTQNIFRGF